MKKIVGGIVIAYIFLVTLDAITTFWAVSIGFREVNPLLHPLAHTYWIFPVMILPAIFIGILIMRFAGQIQKAFAIALISGLAIWAIFLVRAIINNGYYISIFV